LSNGPASKPQSLKAYAGRQAGRPAGPLGGQRREGK